MRVSINFWSPLVLTCLLAPASALAQSWRDCAELDERLGEVEELCDDEHGWWDDTCDDITAVEETCWDHRWWDRQEAVCAHLEVVSDDCRDDFGRNDFTCILLDDLGDDTCGD